MIRAKITYFILTGLVIYMLECESNEPDSPEKDDNTQITENLTIEGSVTDASDCKQFKTADFFSELPDTVSCIEYSFDADSNILIVKHLNAGFNCCPESMFCSVSASGDTIIIPEFEAAALCKCLCLYDLEIKIEGIEAKPYQLKFVEPYSGEMQQLVFEIDLSLSNTGSYCVTRKNYPMNLCSI